MGSTYKNVWSLNADEVVVAGTLQNYLSKDWEVFMPLNAQLKDIDLIAADLTNRKTTQRKAGVLSSPISLRFPRKSWSGFASAIKTCMEETTRFISGSILERDEPLIFET